MWLSIQVKITIKLTSLKKTQSLLKQIFEPCLEIRKVKEESLALCKQYESIVSRNWFSSIGLIKASIWIKQIIKYH